jgi:hypothetical protein
MDWFERITGFKESDYDTTQSRLSVVDDCLASTHSPTRWSVGHLETPSLSELEYGMCYEDPCPGPATFQCISGDARQLHLTAPEGSMFQVASQFNLLEMVGPDVSPEDGVTLYQHDRTQGPACAIAAGAATIYRNYLMPIGDAVGQRTGQQFDGLLDIGAALGNANGHLWKMRNGYVQCTAQGLKDVEARIAQMTEQERGQLRGRLRIGVHRDAHVTDALEPGHFVSQAFCSALPVAYSNLPSAKWANFAQLVLEAAYEATLRAAALYASDDHRTIYLTRLGGGAFGNDDRWIDAAMQRAVLRVGMQANLNINLVCFGGVTEQKQRYASRLNEELKRQWDDIMCAD